MPRTRMTIPALGLVLVGTSLAAAEQPAPAAPSASVLGDERAQKLLEELDEVAHQRASAAVREFEALTPGAKQQALATTAAQLRRRIEQAVATGKKVPATVVLMGRKTKAEVMKCENEFLVLKLGGDSSAGEIQLRWSELGAESLADSARACIAKTDSDGVTLLLKAYSYVWGAELAAQAQARARQAAAAAKPKDPDAPSAARVGQTFLSVRD